MSGIITSEAVVAYSQCARKAFFVLHGQSKGLRHDFERVVNERAIENRDRYIAGFDRNEFDASGSVGATRRLKWTPKTGPVNKV